MDFHLPELGEGVYEAELVEWRVGPGDAVRRGQDLAEVVTDKASMPLPAPFFGRIGELRAQPGDMLRIGEVILTYEPTGKVEAEEERRSEGAQPRVRELQANGGEADRTHGGGVSDPPFLHASPASLLNSSTARTSAAPSIRRMARQLGIDLAAISGSGPGGRVLIDDLTACLKRDGVSTGPAEPAADYGSPGTRRKLIGIRRQIAEHMVHAKRTIPHYSYVDECDATELVRLRASVKATLAQRGLKLTYLPFFVKAVVEALREVPIVNASLDEATGEIVLHDRYDIGIAVATPSGLLVPVIRQADRKDIPQLAAEIEHLSRAAREGTAKRDDLRGGTFTITSIGSIGGLISTPVINHPEAGILGIGRLVKRPMYDVDGNLRPADLVYLSFSFDHRILDGAVGAAFGNAVIRRLENPAALLVCGQATP